MLTDTQRRTAQAIVNIFETSSVRGDYSQVTLLKGDTGQLTYGRSQTTLASGNLTKLIARYCTAPGAQWAGWLRPYLPQLEQQESRLNTDGHFHNILRASADDVVMRDTQDAFFDDTYWTAAARVAARDDITTPLGVAVVYDSWVHGSWSKIRNQVTEAIGSSSATGEQAWITKYVETRHAWLWTKRISDLGGTPVPIADGYQTRIGKEVGIPKSLIDLFALTVVVEERAQRRYLEHARRPDVDPDTRLILHEVTKDEKWHVGWIKNKLKEMANANGGLEKMQATLERYRQIDLKVVAEMQLKEREAFGFSFSDESIGSENSLMQ